MKKSTALGAMSCLLTALVCLSGCGRTEGTTAASDPATTIGSDPATGTVTLWAMGTEGELLPDFLETFEEANPDVTVEVTAIPWDSAHSKIQTAIAGGTTPDMAMMGTTWMADFADSFATVPDDLDTSGFFEGPLDSTMSDDRAVGVPWYVDTRVLYYRSDLAEQAGWSTPPTSWDELYQMASDLQAKTDADYGIRFPSSTDSFQGSLWMPWSDGAELTADGEWTLDTPQMAEAYTYYQKFYTDGVADPDADVSSGAQEAEFVDGSTPMFIDGPFELSQLDELGGDGFDEKYDVATLPAKTTSASFSGGSNLVVFDDSDNASAAWKLARWLSDPEVQEQWYEVSGDLPATESAWDSDALSGDEDLQVFGTQLDTAQTVPVSTSWTQVSAAGDQMLEHLRRGTESVADALTELQATADSIGLD